MFYKVTMVYNDRRFTLTYQESDAPNYAEIDFVPQIEFLFVSFAPAFSALFTGMFCGI